MKKAFTLAEAVLTMVILGMIAAVMLNIFKPSRYKEQAYVSLKQKAYQTVDEATHAVLTQCTWGTTLTSIYPNCDKTQTTRPFSEDENLTYAVFMNGTPGAKNTANGICPAETDYTSLRLKNNICLYFKPYEIFVDVNGETGPNDERDRFTITLGTGVGDGVISDKPED